MQLNEAVTTKSANTLVLLYTKLQLDQIRVGNVWMLKCCAFKLKVFQLCCIPGISKFHLVFQMEWRLTLSIITVVIIE